jgi:hypothetical protein
MVLSRGKILDGDNKNIGLLQFQGGPNFQILIHDIMVNNIDRCEVFSG